MSSLIAWKSPGHTAYDNARDWLLARRKGLGSSDMPDLLGLSLRWGRSPFTLYHEKVSDEEPDTAPPSEAAEWGHRHEPAIALKWASAHPGHKVLDPGRWTIFHPAAAEPLQCSPDRLVLHPSPALCGPLELKTTKERYASDWDDDPPLNVQVQVQQQMLVLGSPIAYVAVLIGGCEYRQFTLQAELHFHELLRTAAKRFWNDVESRTEPRAIAAADARLLRRLYASVRGAEIEAPELAEAATAHYELARELRELKSRVREMEYQREALEAPILQTMGCAERARVGNLAVSAKTIDVKEQLRAAYSYRTVRVKETRDNGRPNATD